MEEMGLLQGDPSLPPATPQAGGLQCGFSLMAVCRGRMLRDVRSRTKSPVWSPRSEEENTGEGISGTHPECQCPVHSEDQHPVGY